MESMNVVILNFTKNEFFETNQDCNVMYNLFTKKCNCSKKMILNNCDSDWCKYDKVIIRKTSSNKNNKNITYDVCLYGN